ncbi:MAG TPA: aldolase/citrate lyase family protein [Pseudonocardia sp.]|jgi:4-hydroxy-2-oxoheptanedioate aldolase|uniref:HpcH/HpaI aldolase family protein n=1 Tax=Pseudonocardia sp. TaxID=60912 RepID=UPI002ED96EF1
MTGNRLRRVWDTRPALGAWCWIPAPAVVEQLVWGGFDFILFDCQHGEFGVGDLEPLLRVTTNTEVTPVVRVPTNDYYAIGHALDAGAEVVVVPMVETKADAERAAAATRFFPTGTRSYAGTRSTRVLGTDPEQVNREVACLAMVETATGLANVAEIAGTEGIDGIFIGPADLAITLGLPPGPPPYATEVERAIDQVVAACVSAGVVPGLAAGSDYAARGLRFLTVTGDRALLQRGRSELEKARAALG